MRHRPSVFASLLPVVLALGGLVVASCSSTPSDPSSLPAGPNASGVTVAAPTPTGTPDKCTCTNVAVQFDPDGANPAWGTYVVKKGNSWRVGFRIDVTCTGTGQSNQCTVYQIEKGALTWTVDGRQGQIVGKSSKVTSFPKVKIGDTWVKEYSDALGADYPANSTGRLSATLDMEFEIKCTPPDDPPVTKRFRVQGSVDAQAATPGGQPALTNGTMTLTPLG